MHRALMTVCVALVLVGAALGADEIVESVAGPTFQYSGAFNPETIAFTTTEPITGVAMTGDWSSISGDLGGGSYPWPLDLAAIIVPPAGATATFGPTFTGDVSIGDYPINDASGPIFPGTAGPGSYVFQWFDNLGQAGSLAQVANPVYHATTTVPDVEFRYVAEFDDETSWNRPFFLGGVSGLGPTSYGVFAFTVDTPGRYVLTSVLEVEDNHMSFLYKGAFDDTQPLANIIEYGLGNGFSVNDDPQGTSLIDTLLFPGEVYYWVTSTWASFSPTSETAENTIVGPGMVEEFVPGCVEDFDNDGDVDLTDFGTFGAAFGSMTGDANYNADADFDSDGDVDLTDFGTFGAAFGQMDC